MGPMDLVAALGVEVHLAEVALEMVVVEGELLKLITAVIVHSYFHMNFRVSSRLSSGDSEVETFGSSFGGSRAPCGNPCGSNGGSSGSFYSKKFSEV